MILLQLAALAALAAEPAPGDQAARHLQAALSALGDADFDTCLREVDAGTHATQDDAVLTQLYLAQGRCLGALQRWSAVEQSFTHALEHDPEVHLDPTRVLPALVVMLDSLRTQLRGTLSVNVKPPGARVTLDGKDEGGAPLVEAVPIGRHHLLAVSDDGKARAEDDALVRPGLTTDVSLQLVRPPPPPSAEPTVMLQADAFGAFDPLNGFGAAVGLSVRGRFWFVGAHGSYGLNPGADLQLGFRVPSLLGPVGAFANAEGHLLFPPSGPLPGAGGAAGLFVMASSRFEVFGQGGVCQYLNGPAQSTLWTMAAGLRARLY